MKISLEKKDSTEALPTESLEEPHDPRFPSVFLSGVKNLGDLKSGMEMPATVRVKSVSKREEDGETDFSAELEILSIETTGKKKTEKEKMADDKDAIEEGLKEAEKKDEKDDADTDTE